jgi:hypothetical protein
MTTRNDGALDSRLRGNDEIQVRACAGIHGRTAGLRDGVSTLANSPGSRP